MAPVAPTPDPAFVTAFRSGTRTPERAAAIRPRDRAAAIFVPLPRRAPTARRPRRRPRAHPHRSHPDPARHRHPRRPPTRGHRAHEAPRPVPVSHPGFPTPGPTAPAATAPSCGRRRVGARRAAAADLRRRGAAGPDAGREAVRGVRPDVAAAARPDRRAGHRRRSAAPGGGTPRPGRYPRSRGSPVQKAEGLRVPDRDPEGVFGSGGGPRATRPNPPAHDAFTRLLIRLEPDPDTPCARSCGSRPIASPKGSVGWTPKPPSFGTRFAPTAHDRKSASQDR